MHYSEAALKARFKMAKINGIKWDNTFLITYANISACILLIRLTAKFIKETDTIEVYIEVDTLQLIADMWQDRFFNTITKLERLGYNPIASLVKCTLSG